MPKRRKKPLVCTEYKYQSVATGRWCGHGDGVMYAPDYSAKTFAQARTTALRFDVDETKIRVVTCRCRALSTRTKASKKRTR